MNGKMLLYLFSFFKQQLKELFGNGSAFEKLFFFSYVISSFALLLYSYTQVDLGLVITRVSWLYAIEKKFQYIGYFNRPLSALLFVSLLIIFTILYIFIWRLSHQKKIKSATIWSIIGIVTIILTFSYNAFSYDLFNYIFDAKILTHYHQNPYLHKALDYPQDPMLGFMHWTHRTYPYGPVWLILTVPISFIGANIFIVTFFLFKSLMAASFLVLLYFLYQILKKSKEKNVLENVILFALNPLILFECLLSAHNDIVMMAFSVGALFFLIQKKYWLSVILLLISIGIKFATVALLPIFLVAFLLIKKKKTINQNKIFLLSSSLMLLPLFFVTTRTNFQPWYLLYVLPFILFIEKRLIRYVIIFISIGSLFLYTSFLATGDWHSIWYTIPENVMYWLIAGVGLVGICYALYTLFRIAFVKENK